MKHRNIFWPSQREDSLYVRRFHHRYGPIKERAWLPKRMDSGKWIWLSIYYRIEHLRSADPRHNFVEVQLYSEKEYFLKRLADEISH